MSKYGKIFYIHTKGDSDLNSCIFSEINSNYDNLMSIELGKNNAIGLSSKNEILQWERDKKNNNDEYSFLLSKPTYHFIKMKFSKIVLNSSVCIGLDSNYNLFVWGFNNEGLLGLGYDVVRVDNPTRLETINSIKELSISENHAVVINFSGDAYSWGNGKYGELGLLRTIYSPFPTKFSNDKKYSIVFCGELLTCLIDKKGKFSYYGVIIRVYKGNNSSVTMKNLLGDETNSDPNFIFSERKIYELDKEKFISICIGNGYIGLLSDKGLVYSLDHSDNITLLFSKYFVFSLAVSNNELYGLCKDNKFNFLNNNLSNTSINLGSSGYCLTRWITTFSENEVISDYWNTFLYRISDEINIENISLLNCKNRDILLFFQNDVKLNSAFSNNDSRLYGDNNLRNDKSANIIELNKDSEIFTLIKTYDDSYNIKYKRVKNYNGVRAMTVRSSLQGRESSIFQQYEDEDYDAELSKELKLNLMSNFSNKSNNLFTPENTYQNLSPFTNQLLSPENNGLFSPNSIVQFYDDSSKYYNKKDDEIQNTDKYEKKRNFVVNNSLTPVKLRSKKEIGNEKINKTIYINSDDENRIGKFNSPKENNIKRGKHNRNTASLNIEYNLKTMDIFSPDSNRKSIRISQIKEISSSYEKNSRNSKSSLTNDSINTNTEISKTKTSDKSITDNLKRIARKDSEKRPYSLLKSKNGLQINSYDINDDLNNSKNFCKRKSQDNENYLDNNKIKNRNRNDSEYTLGMNCESKRADSLRDSIEKFKRESNSSSTNNNVSSNISSDLIKYNNEYPFNPRINSQKYYHSNNILLLIKSLETYFNNYILNEKRIFLRRLKNIYKMDILYRLIINKEESIKKNYFLKWMNFTHIAYGLGFINFVLSRKYFKEFTNKLSKVDEKIKRLYLFCQILNKIHLRNKMYTFLHTFKKIHKFKINYQNYINSIYNLQKIIKFNSYYLVIDNFKKFYKTELLKDKLEYLIETIGMYKNNNKLIFITNLKDIYIRNSILFKYINLRIEYDINLKHAYFSRLFRLSKEIIFIQLKLKNLIKIYRINLYKILIKIFYTWKNIMVTEKSLKSYESLSFISYDSNDRLNKFHQLTKIYTNRQLIKTKFLFLQKIYTKYIFNKFSHFVSIIKMILTKKTFLKILFVPCFDKINKNKIGTKNKSRDCSMSRNATVTTIDYNTNRNTERSNRSHSPISLINSNPTPKFIQNKSKHSDSRKINNSNLTCETKEFKRNNIKLDRSNSKNYIMDETAINFVFNKNFETDEIDSSSKDFRLLSSSGLKKSKAKVFKYCISYLRIFYDIIENLFHKKRKSTFHKILIVAGNKRKNKIYSAKILYRSMKRRMYFYKLKFFHRLMLLYTYLLKDK